MCKWHLIKGVFHCNLICINLRLNMCVLVFMLHRFVAAYLCSHIQSVILVYNVLFSMQSGDRVEVEKQAPSIFTHTMQSDPAQLFYKPIRSQVIQTATPPLFFFNQSRDLYFFSWAQSRMEIQWIRFVILLLRCASFLSSPQNHLKKSIASFFHKLRTLQGSYNTRRKE